MRNWIQGPRPQPVVLPAALPPQFDEKKFVALLSAARSHAELRASAALLSRQELLSSHASALTRIPDEAWARLQEYVSDYGAKFMKPLVEHVQRMARAQHALSLSPPHSPEVAMLSRSEHGRLGNLVTDGVYLYAVAADKLLRISPIDGSIAVVTALPGSDIELASCGSSLVFTSRSAGTIGRVDAQRAQVEIWSSDRVAPRMPFHCGLRAHWIEQFETSEQYASLARIRQHGSWTEGEPDLLSLISVRSSAICGDSGSICILEPSADRRTQLRWLQSDGLHFEGVPPTAPVSAEAASPILALGATHAFWPAQEKVLWTLKLDTMYEVRATASGAVAAIVPDEQNLYVLVGNPQQRVWSVEYAAAGQNETRPLGYFERRESDRVSAIELGGRLFFACGELVYGAGLPRRLRTR